MKQKKHRMVFFTIFVVILNFASVVFAVEQDTFLASVETDWASQEFRMGRTPDDLSAIHDAMQRGERLIADLVIEPDDSNVQYDEDAFQKLREKVNTADSLGESERLALYKEIRWFNRELALQNPLFASKPIVFMQRKRFICQMLHEYLGYYYDYEDIAGGGVYLLEHPGHSFAVRDLIRDRLPRGNFTTLSLSFDASTIYFAFAERAAEKPDYYSPERRTFHIYAMDAEGNHLRKLTDGVEDDFDPCELPDGGLAFMSTRRGGFGRCHNVWEPLPAYTLHRMNRDGTNVQTLSFHETNEWHPNVLHDGRIVYIRWDYVDRNAANFHGLWVSNPDGSNPLVLFGSYTMQINACYQPHPIPGSDRILFVAGAHHADVGGSLVIVDPKRAEFDKESGQDSFDSLEVLTPEICFPEGVGWPKSYFHSPWPLSENYYLVSFSFDPLPGMGSKVKEDTKTGIYYMDRFGNLELLYRAEGISSMYPIPLQPRSVPPVIPSTLDPKLGDEGEYMLTDVRVSHFELPESRPIRELRIFQVLPKTETHVANQPRLGYANAESARMLLGAVPVEADGSAYFRAPARKPIYFQAVDEKGKAVQTMRSVSYLQRGEQRGCIGCHEPRKAVVKSQRSLAMLREPSIIQPGPDGSHPWSFPRLVQPLLNRHCVQCHNGSSEGTSPALIGDASATFSVSYVNLRPYVRWYEWGDATIHPIVTKPGQMPSDVSPLSDILDMHMQVGKVKLSDEELWTFYLWLDGNASFYGAYSIPEQIAQARGEAIPPPALQ
ncbi:MAG: hypothetical protein C4527_26415 [Candidatus Omnitrophota bacterium]|nr:MAG: hypothetical protein C4527_26415 [Candidatus Omnitrophota bacterium]